METYIRFLGTAATQPYNKRCASGIMYHHNGINILLDCGEGITRQILIYCEAISVDAIFITHFHGDHWYGIFGLLDTLNKNNRTEPLNLYGPKIPFNARVMVLEKSYSYKINFIPVIENIVFAYS